MIYNWGDESIHIRNMAAKVSGAPYNYENDISYENELGLKRFADLGITRTESTIIAASVAGALMIFSAFIYSDTVKDGVSEIPEIMHKVVTYPSEMVDDIRVGLSGIPK